MNILVPDSWLKEFLETNAKPDDIMKCLSLCGPSVEKIDSIGDDYIYNVEITSNRVDCASIYGFAREAKAILPRFGFTASLKTIKQISPVSDIELPIIIEDKNRLCDRLLAVVLTEVVVAPSPAIISARLEKSGIRSLNNLIDVTNYLMLELGHPIHVFDYDRIKTHRLVLRKAKSGEQLVTLDGKICNLSHEDIIIDDGTGRIIDLPGIMGTQNSVVTPDTKRILLFIESNNPAAIRKTSMRLALRSVAATINEKHPDPALAETALLRGIELYQQIAKAKIASKIIDIYPEPPKPKSVLVSTDFINQKLGISLTKEEIIAILKSLNFATTINNNELTVTPPSYRQFDIAIADDIVEEVARIYGFHNLPSRLPAGEIPIGKKSADFGIAYKIKTALKNYGFTEIYTYSMISKDLIDRTGLSKSKHLKLSNPLTEEIEYLRISLVPSMLQAVEKNQNYTDNLALFELAKTYQPQRDDLPKEIWELVITSNLDYRKLKGVITRLLTEMGIDNYQEQPTSDWLFGHPKKSLSFLKNNEELAKIGSLHPVLSEKFHLKNNLYLAQVNFDTLIKNYQPNKKYTPIPLFPAIKEDLTFQVKPDTFLGYLMESIKKTDPIINKLQLVDSYKNSYTLRIYYQHPNKNLSDQDVKNVREKILLMLQEKYSIKLKE